MESPCSQAAANASVSAQIRSVLRTASAMPKNQPCITCPEAALYRCIQCGTNAYYCHDGFGQESLSPYWRGVAGTFTSHVTSLQVYTVTIPKSCVE